MAACTFLDKNRLGCTIGWNICLRGDEMNFVEFFVEIISGIELAGIVVSRSDWS